MQTLTNHWRTFERSAADCVNALAHGVASKAAEAPPLRCYDMLLYLLEDRLAKRDEFRKRTTHSMYVHHGTTRCWTACMRG